MTISTREIEKSSAGIPSGHNIILEDSRMAVLWQHTDVVMRLPGHRRGELGVC
jgi:hypothetical protein